MHVFISHSSTDDVFVTQLAADLRAVGVDVWVDHEDILPGRDWDESIQAALDHCDSMILILSPRAVDSDEVKVEWRRFLRIQKPLIPVMIKTCEIPYRLGLHQFVDFTESYMFERLMRALEDDTSLLRPAQPQQDRPTSVQSALIEPEMVLIPAGLFPYAHVRKWIDLPAFWIGRYPVRVKEYRAFVDMGGYRDKTLWGEAREWIETVERTAPHAWHESQWTGDDELPVIGVMWFEAIAFCNWLKAQTGKPFRLPTDQEWEKAARGTNTWVYPWGNEWYPGLCNVKEENIGHTTPVGRFSPMGDSPYGLADMAGNVWEWCSTKLSELDPKHHNQGADYTASRIIRGGAWGYSHSEAQTDFRFADNPTFATTQQGFRVAMDVEG